MQQTHDSLDCVHLYYIAIMKDTGRDFGADDTGLLHLARDDSGVTETHYLNDRHHASTMQSGTSRVITFS